MTKEKVEKLLNMIYSRALETLHKSDFYGASAYYDCYFNLLCLSGFPADSKYETMLLDMQEKIFDRKPPATRRPA